MTGAPKPWAISGGHLDLRVRLTPKSQKDAVEPLAAIGNETVLKARVRALPNGGAANRALEILCAKWLSVPKSTVTVAIGAKSRIKTLRIEGDPAALERRIVDLLKSKPD